MTKALVCKDLIKTYGDEETKVFALRGVNLELETGKLLMIVGPSGSGKTTFLSIASGILHQDSGECLVFGKNLNALNGEEKSDFRKKNIGFIFQALHLIPSLTAIENVSIPLMLNDVPFEAASERAKELLTRVGLGGRMHALPTHMSGGEQQRVGICRGCVHNPRLIVCDEPTSTLDHESGIKVLQLLKEIAVDKEKALIIVTHDPRIFEFADQILKMEDGQLFPL